MAAELSLAFTVMYSVFLWFDSLWLYLSEESVQKKCHAKKRRSPGSPHLALRAPWAHSRLREPVRCLVAGKYPRECLAQWRLGLHKLHLWTVICVLVCLGGEAAVHLLDMKRDGKPTEGFVCSYDSETSEESCWQIEVMLILVIISLACTGITVAFVFSFCAMSGERGIEKVKLPTLMLAVFTLLYNGFQYHRADSCRDRGCWLHVEGLELWLCLLHHLWTGLHWFHDPDCILAGGAQSRSLRVSLCVLMGTPKMGGWKPAHLTWSGWRME